MLEEANYIHKDIEMISLVMGSAFIIGLLKNKFIMSKFNEQNIKRINELTDPKIYQFFESRFFIFLVLMIAAGISLSNYASGDYTMLLVVGGLDLALSTALLKSSTIFFIDKSIRIKS